MKGLRSLSLLVLVSLLLLAPVVARADGTRRPHADITIVYDGELDRAHGIRSGHGTMMDPYIISGWTVNNISIRDTDKAIKIMDNTIAGTLTLDWVGNDVDAMSNDIGDLRVNQNNAHWGDPTAGMIMYNTFASVGQLRHFSGMFSYNTVGQPQSGTLSSSYPDTRAVNFDGFNGAHFDHNTIYGYVDARLHGHHHSSAYGQPSHLHADSPHNPHPMDHTNRFHEVFISDNKIYSSNTYALSYLDTDHAANDRTANSETNPWLNAPHVHHTKVHMVRNQLFGSGILVDVFNARDEKHKATARGVLDIIGNTVTLEQTLTDPRRQLQGIEVRSARDVNVNIKSDVINGPAALVDIDQVRSLQTTGSGILLETIEKAAITIDSARINNRQFGVRALQLTKSVTWTIKNLQTSKVIKDVSYDNTVANAPKRG